MTVHATDSREGFFLFVHHDRFIEYSWNIDERIAVILTKPDHEVAARLQYLTYVPEALLPPDFAEAERTWAEAKRTLAEAERTWVEAERTWAEAKRTWAEAGRTWVEAERTCRPELEALARHLVPGVPWHDGQLQFAAPAP